MDLRLIKRLRNLCFKDSGIRLNRVYVISGRVYLTDGKFIWIEMGTDLSDGSYGDKLDRTGDVLEELGYQLGTGMRKVVDVSGVPKEIVNYVEKNGFRTYLGGIYLDSVQGCVVATDGNTLYSHNLDNLQESLLLRATFWRLMLHFKLGGISTDGKYSVVEGNGVRVIGLLMEESYPDWFYYVKKNKGYVGMELTDNLKEVMIKGLKRLKPYMGRLENVYIDGCYMEVISELGSKRVNIGVELFPGRVFMLSARKLLDVLKVACGEIIIPKDKYSAIVIRDTGTCTLIIPLKTFKSPEDMEFTELTV